MILIFNVTDHNGKNRRLSAVCAPSTTAAGAINLFRTRAGVPASVKVEVHLENNIPIRHHTAPLTSLRKQRGGANQVLQIILWVVLNGPAETIAEVDFKRLEEVNDDDDEDDDAQVEMEKDALEELGSSWTARGERQRLGALSSSAGVNNAPRIIKERSPSTGPVREEAADVLVPPMPMTARRAAAVSVRIAMPAPLTARVPMAAGRVASVSPSADSTATAAERVKKSNSFAAVAEHGEKRQPVVNGTHSHQRHTDPQPLQKQKQMQTVEEPQLRPPPPPIPDRGHTVRRDCKLAQIMIREYPKVLDLSASARIAAVVHDDERLRGMSFDPSLHVPSAVGGLSDKAYSRYLSTGLVHGIELRSATLGHKLAIYGALNSLRHSCRPNAAVHLELFTEPHSASCRCAVVEGLHTGDEITYLYRHADSQAFLLLSRERRRNLLRKRYFFDCTCVRCQAPLVKQTQQAQAAGRRKTGKPAAGSTSEAATSLSSSCSPPFPGSALEAESTLTGCFFTDSACDRDPEKQDVLSEKMRKDFDALQIMSDDGLEITLSIPGNVPPIIRTKQCNNLLQFLRKYASAESVLRLHEYHWRLNMVRAAYIQETVRLCAVKGVTPDARRRDPNSKTLFTPTRTVYDLCLKQLAVEGLFIPAGHPHRLTTYESFQYLVSILTPTLASAVMKQARTTSRINWEELQLTKGAWGLLKRVHVPPSVLQQQQQQHRGTNDTAAVD